jgi:hypothetical protein
VIFFSFLKHCKCEISLFKFSNKLSKLYKTKMSTKLSCAGVNISNWVCVRYPNINLFCFQRKMLQNQRQVSDRVENPMSDEVYSKMRKEAKQVDIWIPHTNPVRNINPQNISKYPKSCSLNFVTFQLKM